MNQATLAWSAFKNMLRAAGRDPVWAVVALITAPFRAIQPVLSGLALLGLVLVIVGIGGAFLIEAIGLGSSQAASLIHQLLVATLLVVLSFRLLTNPLILHFGDMEGETHGRQCSRQRRGPTLRQGRPSLDRRPVRRKTADHPIA